MKLSLGELLLTHRTWLDRLGGSEGGLLRLLLESRLLLLEKLLLLRLLLLWLEELLLRLGRLEGGLLLRLEMSWKGINLTILIIISGETLKSNLFSGQLRQRSLLWLLWSKLLLLLGKLLRLLCKLLWLLSKLLLGSKLLLLLRSKLLLLSGHKLL